MAMTGTKLADRTEEIMLPEEYKSVLEILAEFESMPFLELSSLTDMGHDRLNEIVNDLERDGFVKVTSKGNILDEIVTAKETAGALASTAL